MAQITDEQLSQLLSGRRKIHRVDMPGMDGVEVGVRCLSDLEVDDARLEAHHYLAGRCKRQNIDPKVYIDLDPDALDQEQIRQVVFRAFVDPDSEDPEKPTPFFERIEDVRKLDSVLITKLFQIYRDWSEAMNPEFHLSDEQMEELVESLKKDPKAEMALAQYAPDTLASCLRFMARQLSS